MAGGRWQGVRLKSDTFWPTHRRLGHEADTLHARTRLRAGDPSRRAGRLRPRHRARQRVVGRARHGADAAAPLLRPFRGHELCRRRRGRPARSVPDRLPLADDRHEAYIHFVGVSPDRRGAGLGRHLYERFFDDVRARGRTPVHCVTSPANEGSVAFHRALGFEVERIATGLRRPRRRSGALRQEARAELLTSQTPCSTSPRAPGPSATFNRSMSGPFMSVASRPRRPLGVLSSSVAVRSSPACSRARSASSRLLERDSLPRGTTIGGVAVGGLSEVRRRVGRCGLRLHERVDAARSGSLAPAGPRPRAARELRARRSSTPRSRRRTKAGTVRRVLARLGLRDGPDVPLPYGLPPSRPRASRTDSTAASATRRATPGRGRGRAVRVVEARPGTGVDRGALRRALRTLPPSVDARDRPLRPVVSTGEATLAAQRIERLLDGPRRVRFQDAESTLTPPRLRTLVGTTRENGSLASTSTRKASAPRCASGSARSSARPRDATFGVSGSRAARRAVEAGSGARGRADRPLADEEPELDDAPRLVLALAARPHDRRGGATRTSASSSRSSRPTTPAASRA